MRISDWSSDVCSSDLWLVKRHAALGQRGPHLQQRKADLEKLFDIVDFLLVDVEQDPMVLGLDHGIVMRNDDVVASQDVADRGSGRQLAFLEATSDHLHMMAYYVRNGLDRPHRAAADYMNAPPPLPPAPLPQSRTT